MQVLKHILLGGWYHRGLIIHQQRYQPSGVKHNQHTLTPLKIKQCHSKFHYIALITLSRTWFSKLVNKVYHSLHHSMMFLVCYISCHYCFFHTLYNFNLRIWTLTSQNIELMHFTELIMMLLRSTISFHGRMQSIG